MSSTNAPLSGTSRYSAVRGFIVLVSALAGILALPGVALGAYSAGPDIQFTGSESTPFDWTTQRCDDYHIPDLGVRAFRDAGAEVITSTDVSCLAHLDGVARRAGVPLRTLHVAEILAEACG